MPVMTEPLAHLESLLEGIRFDIERTLENITKESAKLGVLQEYERRIRICLRDERAKITTSPGDATDEKGL